MAGYRRDTDRRWIWRILLVPVLGLALAIACDRKPRPIIALPTATTVGEELWRQAAEQVEEDRKEPMGSKARVVVPAELKQYSEPHEFLGTQVAEFRKEGYRIPQDYGDLAALIQAGELVEMPAVGKDYVLFGIGGRADGGPLTRYDGSTGTSVPLYRDRDDISRAVKELADQISDATGAIAELSGQLRSVKRDRRRATRLRAEISGKQELVSQLEKTKATIDKWYGDPTRRASLFAEFERVSAFAANWEGVSYDLRDPEGRYKFKLRLLSYIRPAARTVLEEIAADYDKQFNRPLPITSMVRTVEYQKELGEVNPNAARNAVPPHTSGLAFDVYYHYMTAAEQAFLMNEIARMKDAGRVEALRENRDHFHIFAFADGRRPPQPLIAESKTGIGDTGGSIGSRARIATTIRWKPHGNVLRLASHRRTRS